MIDNIYVCPRCNYSTNVTQCYTRHIKRKKKCEAINSNISLETEYDNFIIKQKKKTNKKKS